MRGLYPVSTAGDIAKLFSHIYRGDLLKPASNDYLLDALKNQTVNNRLPTGLPAGVSLAHKTGDLEGSAHDGGIVYSQTTGDYIVVVLSAADPSGRILAERYARFGDLTRDIHQLFVDNANILTPDAGAAES
jgi:beta-lactamase class A